MANILAVDDNLELCKLIRTTLQAGADTQIVPYSAQTKQGREEIYEILDGILAAEDPAQE